MLLINESFFFALFEYSFLKYALLTGLIMGFVTPIIGSFVVIRRLSFIADTLSHFSLAGLSIGLFLINIMGFTFISDPLYLAMIFSVIGALFIEILRGYYQNYKEISMPIVMSLGTALSALFISLSGGFNSSIYNYLFGSILTVGDEYLIFIAITTAIVLGLLFIFYKEMVMISFDETYAKLLGIKIARFQFVSTIILAVIVSLSIATVGVLLVSSLMIIPVAAAMKVGKSFKNTIIIAIMFSETSIIGGLWLSYELDIASGATIVLLNLLILVLVGLFRRFYVRKRLKQTQLDIQGK
ncbi:MAG: High-affinity zinc uptake system membrane protein ZnuB [Candidatus Izimaplasma bacterium HR2]|nr:MAG: High-affinity zinc uptake system membrane protein ZnuB [Candidatus Izimaplasma bacterium HR2]